MLFAFNPPVNFKLLKFNKSNSLGQLTRALEEIHISQQVYNSRVRTKDFIGSQCSVGFTKQSVAVQALNPNFNPDLEARTVATLTIFLF